MAAAAREAAGKIDGGDRIEVIEGDITDRRLGLADNDYDRLGRRATVAHHLAAIYNLAVPLELGPGRQRRGHRQRARVLRALPTT